MNLCYLKIFFLLSIFKNLSKCDDTIGNAIDEVAKNEPKTQMGNSNSKCDGRICVSQNCPIYNFLHPMESLIVSKHHGNGNGGVGGRRRRKRELVLLTLLTSGWIYKYIVAWIIPTLILNEVCKNTGLDEIIVDCFKMIFLKRRLSCKLPKPVRHSAKFANEVIEIAMEHATAESKSLIDVRYQKFVQKVRDLPPMDFDFGADPKMSLQKLQEAGLISLQPDRVPEAFVQDGQMILEKEEDEKKKEEEEMQKEGGIFGQMGGGIKGMFQDWQGKKEHILEEEIDKYMNDMEIEIDLEDELKKYEQELEKENEKKLAELRRENERKLEELRRGNEKKLAKFTTKLDREFREKMAQRKQWIRRQIVRKLAEERERMDEEEEMKKEEEEGMNGTDEIVEEMGKGGGGMVVAHGNGRGEGLLSAKQNGEVGHFNNLRRKKRFIIAPIAAGILTFFTYNFVRRFVWRIVLKNVNIWLFLKRCFGASMSEKRLKCKLPERFIEEQKFLKGVLKIILQDLTLPAIDKIRARYVLFKAQFPMPVTRGKTMGEHEKLSIFLERIFKGINMPERYHDEMDLPVEKKP